jgi:hypothetical protein
MLREYWPFWPLDRSVEIVIATLVVAVLLPLWFHTFMFWTTRRRNFVALVAQGMTLKDPRGESWRQGCITTPYNSPSRCRPAVFFAW